MVFLADNQWRSKKRTCTDAKTAETPDALKTPAKISIYYKSSRVCQTLHLSVFGCVKFKIKIVLFVP